VDDDLNEYRSCFAGCSGNTVARSTIPEKRIVSKVLLKINPGAATVSILKSLLSETCVRNGDAQPKKIIKNNKKGMNREKETYLVGNNSAGSMNRIVLGPKLRMQSAKA
jgi:hypothetical protein